MKRTRLISTVVGIVLVIILFIGMIIFVKNRLSPSISINLNQAAVIKQIQSLDRLETAEFTIEKVIDAGTSGNAIQQFLVGDRILLIAHGQVIAGFDLSTLSANAIHVSGRNVTLQLPAPQVLVTTLDESQTKVYDRTHGILTPGSKDLETQVRQSAESSIRDAACKENILTTASDNGRKQLEGLLKALGFDQVTVIIPNGSC